MRAERITQPLRIGVITTSHPHAGDRVAGAFVRALSLALAARGHTLRVVCIGRSGDAVECDPGITVTPSPEGLFATRNRLFYDGGAPERLARAWPAAVTSTVSLALGAMRTLGDCDALVSHFVVPGALVGALVAHGRPHHAIVHGSDARVFSQLPRAVRQRVLDGCTTVQCSHPGLRGCLSGLDGADAKTVVAPMGFDPIARVDRDDDGVVTVLALARLVPVKGLDVLLAALPLVTANVRVVIAGDGPERARLEALAAGLPVTFRGSVDAADRDALVAGADLVVVPSRTLRDGRTEGAPAVVLEAMGAGRAVIGSDVGGIAWMMGDTGVCVPEGDARALARAITELAGDGARRSELGARARLRAAPWQWSHLAARIERWLETQKIERDE